MRNNQPVSQRERELPDDTLIISITDTSSRITYVNADFVQASGFERPELAGQFHHLVRHPDMPRQAFADMWKTIQGGDAWTGMIKNRCKNGDHYWVRANATPIEQGGRITGYTSVRVKPSRSEVEAAEGLYRRMREGSAGRLALRSGVLLRTGAFAWLSIFRWLPVRWRIRTAAGTALGFSAAALAFAGASDGGQGIGFAVAGMGAVLNVLMLEVQLERPLRQILEQAKLSARGEACQHLALQRVDEVGLLARAVTQANLNLRSLVKDVTQRAAHVHQGGADLRRASGDLATRTESQASALEETAASMEELAAAIRQNADNARQATTLAESATAVAADGGEVMASVVRTMHGINDSARRISDITGVIDSIAFQTNILA
ncbi:MAG TPA: PAS domain-containing protein, partial [Ramlibacter sp.]